MFTGTERELHLVGCKPECFASRSGRRPKPGAELDGKTKTSSLSNRAAWKLVFATSNWPFEKVVIQRMAAIEQFNLKFQASNRFSSAWNAKVSLGQVEIPSGITLPFGVEWAWHDFRAVRKSGWRRQPCTIHELGRKFSSCHDPFLDLPIVPVSVADFI